MSRQRRLMALAFVVVVAMVGLATLRPWQKPPPVTINAPGLDPLNPTKMVTLAVVKSAGGSGRLIMTGRYGTTFDRAVVNLPDGDVHYLRRVPGPYVLETVTVERDGKTHRQEMTVTVPGGESRQITVNADGSVAVGPVS